MFRINTLIFTLFLLMQSVSQAQTFQPYIKAGIVNESNLFLLTNSDEARQVLGSGSRSDSRLEISPGIRGLIDYQRQKLIFDLYLLRKEYNRFDSLNFTGGQARLNWDWLYGNRWNGQMSYRFTDKQSNFNERLTELGDSSKIHRIALSANRKLDPRYSLISGIAYKTNDYKRRKNLSKDDTELELGLRYTSSAENTIDLIYKIVESEYPNRGVLDINRGVDDGYEDNSLLARVKWQATGKSALDLEAGFTDREQDNISENDFDGLVGRLAYSWAISEKTRLVSSIWRDLRDSEDQLTNFVKVDGIGLELNWDTTAKISSFAKLKLENRDFESNGRVANSPNKEDDYLIGIVGLSYKLQDNIIITADYAYEERDSTLANREFDNDIVNLFVEFGF